MSFDINPQLGWLFILLKAISGIMSSFFAVKLFMKTYQNEGGFSLKKYSKNNGFWLGIFFSLNTLSYFSTMINSIVLYYGDLFGGGVFAVLMGAFQAFAVAVLSHFAFRSFLKNTFSGKSRYITEAILFTAAILTGIGGLIFQIIVGPETNPFSIPLILIALITFIMLLLRTYSSYRLLKEADEMNETLPKLHSLTLALVFQLTSLILIIVDFLLKDVYNTFIGIFGWLILIMAIYYFNKTI